MPSAADLTPEEVAAVLAARRRREAVEDEIPASLAARLDREVAARVEAELGARGATAPERAPARKQKSGDGKAVGIASLIFGIPLMAIVEGTSHGSLGGAFAVMSGIALVNFAQALGRRRD
jgi:hypothetical protein